MKKLLSIIMAGMMIFAAGCMKKEDAAQNADLDVSVAEDMNRLEKIKAAGKIVVGTSADYPPYEFHALIDGKDEIVGFDIEIAKEIAKGLGVELEIQDMGFDAVLAGVGSGLIDIGLAGINPSAERDAEMDFSDIYYQAKHTLLVSAGDKDSYRSVEDLKEKTVGVQIGTVQEEVAKQNLDPAQVKSLGKVTDLVLELKTGLIDAIILEEPVADSYAAQNSDLAVSSEVVFEMQDMGSSVITANDEPELMAEINTILGELKSSGKIDNFVAEATKLSDQVNE